MTNMADGYIRNVRPRIDFMRVGLSNIDTNIPDPIHRDTSSAFGGAAGKSRAWTMIRFSTLLKMLNQTNVSRHYFIFTLFIMVIPVKSLHPFLIKYIINGLKYLRFYFDI